MGCYLEFTSWLSSQLPYPHQLSSKVPFTMQPDSGGPFHLPQLITFSKCIHSVCGHKAWDGFWTR
jgi:hypothetical protein